MNARALKSFAISLSLCIAVANLSAQSTVTTLHSFAGQPARGNFPGGLVQGNDGNFFGTTYAEGTNQEGTIFRMSPSGVYTNLHTFGSSSPNDGAYPNAGLTLGSDGNFYGTTENGGINPGGYGYGTVYRISPSGDYSTIINFDMTNGEGYSPYAGLVQGSDGIFYGTTLQSELFSNGVALYGGMVFSVSSSGAFRPLHYFGIIAGDGYNPFSGVVQGHDGYFYGAAPRGGTNNDGIVYRVATDGGYSILHTFAGPPNEGYFAAAGLTLGNDGNFYGTTQSGGMNNNAGTIFRVSPGGDFTNLYSFGSFAGDGVQPNAPLVLGRDGNFYGTTTYGGQGNAGTVFRISPGGVYTNLYSFGLVTGEGNSPYAPLVLGRDGSFYGIATAGGTNNYGTIFKLTIPTVLNCQNLGNAVVLSWNDPLSVLQSAPAVTGTYTNVPSATSPYTNTLTGPQQFFRLQVSQ